MECEAYLAAGGVLWGSVRVTSVGDYMGEMSEEQLTHTIHTAFDRLY